MNNLLFSNRKAVTIFWFSLNLTFALICGLLSLKLAFSSEYVIQDDARQHVFWMERFLDNQLFPNDITAEFFESVAPWGYTNFYKFFALFGISPIFLSKILPVFLDLIIAGYFFFTTIEIFPIPAAAFVSAVVFNQYLWKFDDLASATPRAFGMVLLIVFIYYLLRYNSKNTGEIQIGLILPCVVAIGLIGLFYPQYIFIATGLILCKLFKPQNQQDYWLVGLSLIMTLIVMLPYVLQVSHFGPTITGEEAKLLPDFYKGGRANFFDNNLVRFFISNERSGILTRTITPPTIALGLLLPFFLLKSTNFPITSKINDNIKLLPQIIGISLILFTIAHLVLFKLHLPSRYTAYTFQIVLAIATGIVVLVIADFLQQWAKKISHKNHCIQNVFLFIPFILIILLTIYPIFWKHFPYGNYIVGKNPEVYQFLAKQPKDIILASLSKETDNLGSFSRRSILFSWEHTIPYQKGYYTEIKDRVRNLINAQYSSKIETIDNFIRQYKINYIIIDKNAFLPEYITRNNWLNQTNKENDYLIPRAETIGNSALVKIIPTCSVFRDDNLIILSADCLVSIK